MEWWGYGSPEDRSLPVNLDRASKLISNVDYRLSQADLVQKVAITVAGVHAFRRYNWLSHEPAMNATGNLRGMVVNPECRAAFRFFEGTDKYMNTIGLLAGVAAGLGEALPEIKHIMGSEEPVSLKGTRMVAIASTVCQRTLLGIVPVGFHTAYKSLQGWCMMVGLLGGKWKSGADFSIEALKDADMSVQSNFKALTDTTNQAWSFYHPRDAKRVVDNRLKEFWLAVDTVLIPRRNK